MTADLYDDRAEASAEFAAMVARKRLDQLLAKRPERFAADGDLDERVAAWADAFTAGSLENLILAGNVGTGKTWAVWRAAERAVRGGYTGRIEIVGPSRFRSAVSPPTDAEALQVMAEAGLLAIDDIGAARLSEWDREHLHGVIDARWGAMLPTVITTNVTDLAGMFGERIASRLSENVTKIMLTGPDRRRGTP